MQTLKLKADPRKILIVKPSSLGDIVHSLPFLNAVKLHFPKAEVHWVVAKGFEGLLDGHPMIDRLWVINKDTWKKIKNVKGTISELKTLSQGLKKEKYDLVIDLQGLLRSGMITAATGARIRIGFKEAREGSGFFYTHKIEGGKDIHAVERYLKIAAFLGCDCTDISFPFPPSDLPSSFALNKDYAVIVPGTRWKTKLWPAEEFGQLAARLPLQSVIVGSSTDKDIASLIVSLSKGKAISLAGKTSLKELIGIMRDAKFVVSNDSGPMHIAAALGIPVFAIFGPTDPAKTGPYGRGHTIIKSGAPCSPCFRKTCDDNQCMKSVSADEAFEIITFKQLRE
jgi:heptosyltransferase I